MVQGRPHHHHADAGTVRELDRKPVGVRIACGLRLAGRVRVGHSVGVARSVSLRGSFRVGVSRSVGVAQPVEGTSAPRAKMLTRSGMSAKMLTR